MQTEKITYDLNIISYRKVRLRFLQKYVIKKSLI